MGLATLGIILTACDETALEGVLSTASVKIENATSDVDNISFDIVVEDAIEVGYLVLEADDVTNSSFTEANVFENAVVLDEAKSQSVKVEELNPDTSYVVVAYAKDEASKIVISAPAYVRTAEAEALASVKLENISASSSEIVFKITPTAAAELGYYYLPEADVKEDSFAEVSMLENATKIEEVKTQEVTLSTLKAETKYAIAAYAKNIEGAVTISDILYITTDKKLATVDIHIKEIATTTETMTFEITPENNPDACYWWFYKKTADFEERDSQTIVSAGETTSNMTPQTYTREGLLDDTTYVVYAVAVETGTYKQIMTRLEITTPALENPVQKEVQEFTEVEFTSFSGRSHTFAFENENYSINVVLQTEVCFEPRIPVGEFTYDSEHGGSTPGAIATTTTTIIDKANGNSKLTINRGSATLSYDSTTGDYTLEGTFQTSKNIHIPYKYVGGITFPIKFHYNSGLYITDGGNYLDFEKADKNYYLKVYLADGEKVAAGEYSFENGKLSDKTSIAISDYEGNAVSTLTFKELAFDFVEESTNYFTIEGRGITTAGYSVLLTGDGLRVDVTDVALPELPVLTLTNPRALCEYEGGWSPYYYSLEFDCEELETFFVGLSLSEGGDYIPEGDYLYMEETGSFQYFEVKTNSGSNYRFYDEGGVTISKEGDNYTLEFAVKLWMGADDRMFKAKYVGPIEVDFQDNSDSGSGYDDYYYSKKK